MLQSFGLRTDRLRKNLRLWDCFAYYRSFLSSSRQYDGLFDDLFERYTTAHTLEKVKTTNMGTLYELRYRITLRQEPVPKVFLDELRCRNGNLNITCCREESHESL